MSSIRTKSLGIFAAKQFREAVSEPSSSNVFLMFGRVEPWNSESSPDQANSSISTVYEVWHKAIGGKRITGNDLRHAIPRQDWNSGTIYNAYDDRTQTTDEANNKCYVVTDDFNVYKCLANANGATSTTKPTSTITTIHFQTADKYIWKYMYTLSSEEQLRFLTDDYMPVKTLTLDDGSSQWDVQTNAVDGGIHVIKVENGGINYTTNNDISIVIGGDGAGANAFAKTNVVSNVITEIIVDNPGDDYTYATVSIVVGNGQGAIARAIISPPGGHGSDPLTELGGSYLIANVQFDGNEDGVLTVANDFRQVSMIEDPYVKGTTNTTANLAVSQVTVLTLNGVSANYQEDEWVYQGPSIDAFDFRGRVVEWDSANSIIKLNSVEGTPTNDLLNGETSAASRYLVSVTQPDLEPYSGKLLYVDNITPIERAIDQIENFQIVLSF
jgi:Bacteriophage T4, Gp8